MLVSLAAVSSARIVSSALAQQPPAFGYNDVVKRARDLAGAAFEATIPPLPDGVSGLDYDAWRDIRFKSDKPLLGQPGASFRLELFHLGHLYRRPVVVNVLRDGIPAPIPYTTGLFDWGRNKPPATAPINLGFAGFRLHYPLNAPHVMDEVIAFLGASYFRFLGRGQRYGLSARGLGIGAGARADEEFPFFREFWIETPDPTAERIVVHALLDSESVTGAYRFEIAPALETSVELTVTLFARKAISSLNMAPLSSMFLRGKNDHRVDDDFREELHDSDGLLIHTGAGEYIWRPLSNPATAAVSTFVDDNVRGFGLLQRDRSFDHYQDLDLAYQLRPTYWIEPHEGWGDGGVELLELPTDNESNDNIVAAWTPKETFDAGRSMTYGYRITSLFNDFAPDAERARDQHLPRRAEGAGGRRAAAARRDAFPHRLHRRRSRLFLERSVADPGRGDDFGGTGAEDLPDFERLRERVPRRRRRRRRSRPELRRKGVPARRQQGVDRDLDFPLAGVTESGRSNLSGSA